MKGTALVEQALFFRPGRIDKKRKDAVKAGLVLKKTYEKY
jgi:hypothetical protein